ncbi:ATP-binding protein [Streptomyces sp. NBC_00557]|uniref:ATP-binding protein n=1 Tax=Streptomyces sp. NBC_00557 TaxID=2975776 RepID=UPI003FCC3D2B
MIPSAPLGTDAAADRSGRGAGGGIPAGAGSRAGQGAASGGGAAERRFRFELAAHPGSVAQARRLAHAWLTGWSVCADTCDSAALVLSELVTNAIVHTASSRVVCELHDRADTVRIAVHDEGCAPGEPHSSPQRPEEEHGRGLLLVDALCLSWGAQEHGPGLLVWAELARRTDTADDTAAPRDDLGWGARPKPDRPDDSDEDDSPEGRQDAAGLLSPRHPEHKPRRGTPEPHPHRLLDRPPHQPPHQGADRHRTGERRVTDQHGAGEHRPEQHRIPDQHGAREHWPEQYRIPDQHRGGVQTGDHRHEQQRAGERP